MGQFVSRALRRLTQCSSNSGNQAQQQENQSATGEQRQQQQQQQQQREQEHKPTVQRIPVGQSIDSAEYAALASSKQTSKSTINTENKENAPVKDKNSARKDDDAENKSPPDDKSNKSNENSPQVEEAVIKIQAYVRGHLTRKALKDAQQQGATLPSNALGQSQFDEDSLMKNPPSAIFSLVSPLNSELNQSNSLHGIQNEASGKLTPKLESIAEETQNSVSPEKKDSSVEVANSDKNRKLLENQSLSLSVDRQSEMRDSASPVPSEANASIDLNCESPASASIDIADHNIQPIDKLASVLHFTASPVPSGNAQIERSSSPPVTPQLVEPLSSTQATTTATTTTTTREHADGPMNASNALVNSSSHSIDSAEAAAIRIQSAFRGYHTRKHSPYRRRSPHLASPTSSDMIQFENESNGITSRDKRTILRQQDATDADEMILLEHDEEEDNRLAGQQVRRFSRQRQRDPTEYGPHLSSAASIEESLATDDSTIKEVHPAPPEAAAASSLEAAAVIEAAEGAEASVECLEPLSSRNDDDNNKQQDNTMQQDMSLRSALDNATATLSQEDTDADVQQQNSGPRIARSSTGAVSLELDTDSSNIGALASLNEDVSEHASEEASLRKISNITEDDSIGANLMANPDDESSAVYPPSSISKVEEQEVALERATEELEAALDDVIDDDTIDEAVSNEQGVKWKTSNDSYNNVFCEDEHHGTELGSDDIEKRDPRGHGSSKRAGSTSKSDQPSLTAGDQDREHENIAQEDGPTGLAVGSPDEAFASGPSTPALVSSDGNASSDDGADSDFDKEESQQHQQQQQQQQQQQKPTSSGGNKNRKKNRNKKKGKK